MPHVKEFVFGTLTVNHNFVIAEMNEGITFSIIENRQILNYLENVFSGRPYGYISHRVNSYSIDPTVYLDSSQNSKMRAIAIVSDRVDSSALTLERQFFTQPIETFQNLQDAAKWMQDLLSKEKALNSNQ
ncbi:hypothetical protein [Croceiramulus getboli]|nr:hypothetical protein P8624_10555 [Flavobacteriaceae bacterium YJPT1-3]